MAIGICRFSELGKNIAYLARDVKFAFDIAARFRYDYIAKTTEPVFRTLIEEQAFSNAIR